jgi:hypothetical protein
MSAADPGAQLCPLCHVALRMRLGEMECPECGYTAPAAQTADRGGAQSAQATAPAPAGSRWSYFTPVRYSPPDYVATEGSLYFEKRLCFRLFVIFELLPLVALLACTVLLMLWDGGLFQGGKGAASGMTRTNIIMFLALGLGIVVGSVGAAIQILIFRWVLFGTNVVPKWGCLALTGLQGLYSVYAGILMYVNGRLAGSTDLPMPVEARAWVALLILLFAVYQGWVVFILQRDIMER